MRPIGAFPLQKEVVISLIHVVGTYDVLTAVGDVMILGQETFVKVAGVGFVSIELLTNQTTTVQIMTAAEGAVANITIDKNLLGLTMPNNQRFQLRNGQKIQLKINGTNGTAGELRLVVEYRTISGGATLV